MRHIGLVGRIPASPSSGVRRLRRPDTQRIPAGPYRANPANRSPRRGRLPTSDRVLRYSSPEFQQEGSLGRKASRRRLHNGCRCHHGPHRLMRRCSIQPTRSCRRTARSAHHNTPRPSQPNRIQRREGFLETIRSSRVGGGHALALAGRNASAGLISERLGVRLDLQDRTLRAHWALTLGAATDPLGVINGNAATVWMQRRSPRAHFSRAAGWTWSAAKP